MHMCSGVKKGGYMSQDPNDSQQPADDDTSDFDFFFRTQPISDDIYDEA